MSTMRAATRIALVALGACLLAPDTASAQATITVTGGDVGIVTDEDGVSTLTVTLTASGVTDPIAVSILVDGTEPGECVPLQQPIVRPGVETEVEFELPAGCDLADTATVEFVTFPFDATTGVPSGVRLDATVSEAASSPEYVDIARGFGAAAVVAIVSVLVAWIIRVGDDPPQGEFGRWGRNPLQRLPGLDKKWTWSESPLSSVTVLSAVFTAVLGASDPLETILGGSGESQAAVVIVAAALAAALTAAAPLAMALLRDEPAYFLEGQDPIPNNYTVLGVMASTAAVMTGSLGLILTVVLALWDRTPINETVLVVGAAAVSGLVVAYAVRSMRRTLKIGTATHAIVNVAGLP
jgi:hypothetical protein